MNPVRRLLRATRGASAVEFALLAPVFLTLLFGIIEGSRMLWLRQTLGEVAFSTVRCMSVSSTCATLQQQQSYALTRASQYGVAITATNLAIKANITCEGNAASNQVSITAPFRSPIAGLISAIPAEITAKACFPKLG
ncbi:TadE/TadG family type IV pilus assembly protein [Sphingomonas sp. OTU376]|uniref:TadE/TadG family type IV pilus assembly protein n=1 Tax=Sphingomonas sp. OTU376 TaxID=3043863 RepID=UPI00313DB9B6